MHSGVKTDATKSCTNRGIALRQPGYKWESIYNAELFNNNDYYCRVYDVNIVAILIYIYYTEI